MEWATALIGLAGALLGAVLSMVATASVEKRRLDAEARAGWNSNLIEVSRDLAASARDICHLAGTAYQQQPEQQADLMNGAMQRVRALSEQVRLVGRRDVQLGARLIRRRAWYVVRTTKTEPAAEERAAQEKAITLLNDALQAYYRAARAQLGVPEPREVIHDDDLDLDHDDLTG